MSTRRNFIKTSSLAASAAMASGILPSFAKASVLSEMKNRSSKVYIFSKHLQWLDYAGMAKTARQIGFDGIDLTVRPKGHVLPERVKEDLPKALEAIKREGLLADRMTTAITDPEDALTIEVLETAAKAGIKNYRLGWLAYKPSLSVEGNIQELNKKLKKLAQLNKELGLTAAYQNHSGEMVGGPVWDIGLMLEGIDPEWLGIRYDVRHATVEGGTSWPLGMKFVAGKINSFDIKDFIWQKDQNKWKPFNVPLGEGMVDFTRYFELIKEYNIKGDYTLHLEYPLGGADKGKTELTCEPEEVIAAMQNDLKTLHRLMQE